MKLHGSGTIIDFTTVAWVKALFLLICWGSVSLAVAFGDTVDRTTIVFGNDPNIKVVMKGRAGNLELSAAEEPGEGHALTDYQKGSGYAQFDRSEQAFKWQTRIPFTLNRLSKHIEKVAPYQKVFFPQQAELDFQLKITSLGYGTLDFSNLNLSRFKFKVKDGDVDIHFPTENQSIMREKAIFKLSRGDLEIYDLANLKASKVYVNGGIGELTIDLGTKLLQGMDLTVDHDIGSLELLIPRGTKTLVRGTSRDMSGQEFQRVDDYWESLSYHRESPTLNIYLTGPVGDMRITWK